MNNAYTMPARHPAVRAAVEQLQEWGAPKSVEYLDYVDGWGWPSHEVRFHTLTKTYEGIAGEVALHTLIAYNDLVDLGMITPGSPLPTTAPVVPAGPGPQKLLDDVIGAADPNRYGMFEPAPGTNPTPGDHHTFNGQLFVAKQVTQGFLGIIRWIPEVN